MSTNYIINATPMVVERGTDDRSTRQVLPEPIPVPQHLPKFYLYTKKGRLTPQLVSGAARDLMYGKESFDPNSQYFNHATLYSNLINAEGNSMMVQRVIPSDANAPANFTLYLDVLDTSSSVVDLPVWERNADGSIVTDPVTGNPVQATDGTNPIVTKGFITRWVKLYSTETDANGGLTLGAQTQLTGTMSADDGSGGTIDSVMYPILDVRASSRGAFGNNAGLRLFPGLREAAPEKVVSEEKVFPYYISAVGRPDANTTPSITKSLYGEESVLFSFKELASNPYTNAAFDLTNIFPDQWENTEDPNLPLSYSDYDDIHVYFSQIDVLTALMAAGEATALTNISSTPGLTGAAPQTAWFNWSDDGAGNPLPAADETALYNFLTFVSTLNVSYYSVTGDATLAGVTDNLSGWTPPPNFMFSEQQVGQYANIMMENGSDGTMSNADFEANVVAAMADYLDPNSRVQDNAINVESIFYDSGFTLPTKLELPAFISQRKDTFIVMSTHSVDRDSDPLSLSEEESVAVALRTMLQNYPESDYFGTPVMRGMVVGLSGKLRNSQYQGRVSLSAEIAIKSARYMGAGDAKWKDGFNFDYAPGSIIDNIYDIQTDFIPANVKYSLWNTGLVWAQPYDRRSYFFPALQTVYNNDTSVLNSYFTAMAICYLNKVAWKAWRRFTGVSSLSNAQLIDRVNKFVEAEVLNRFDNRFVVVPETTMTQQDLDRGYSWTLIIKIYAPNMKTVMTTWVEAYRIEDLV